MPWSTIHKVGTHKVGTLTGLTPNLSNYETTCRSFSWRAARGELDGLAGGGLNIAYEATDRHVARGRGDHRAIVWIGKNDAVRTHSYADLAVASNRFGNVLKNLGVGRGDRVFALAGRIPELYVAAFGTWKNGGVFCPLFSAFGPDPIRQRMSIGAASVLVTTEALYRKKVMPWRSQMSHLRHVLLAQRDSETMPPDTIDLEVDLAAARPDFDIAATQPGDPALLHFTSGTTGRPKGAVHVHEAVVAHHITGKYALDLHPDDIFWCTADPGWVTGTSYGIISPLTNGVTMVVDEAEFDALRWYRILDEQRVTVWYTAPTAIRMLMKVGRGAGPRALARSPVPAYGCDGAPADAVLAGPPDFSRTNPASVPDCHSGRAAARLRPTGPSDGGVSAAAAAT